jgi:hypothetical protein
VGPVADLSERQVGESYKDYAARMAGAARAAEIDRDAALAARDALRAERVASGRQLAFVEAERDALRLVLSGRRTELAQRDTAIAAVRALCEGLQVESVTGGMTDASSLWPSEVLELLSAPVEAGATEPAQVTDVQRSKRWADVLDVAVETEDWSLVEELTGSMHAWHGQAWRRTLAEAGAPAEPTSDTASCGICKLGGRTIHIDDRCAEHGDHDLDDVAGAADTAREDQP